jgi:hypothetical protein
MAATAAKSAQTDNDKRGIQQTINIIYNALKNPRTGVKEPTARAIKQLLQYAYFNKPMTPKIRKRWEEVGYIKDGDLLLDSNLFGEPQSAAKTLILMILCYEGYAKRELKDTEHERQAIKTEPESFSSNSEAEN